MMMVAAGCSLGSAPQEDVLLGRWRVVSFNDDEVRAGVNTAEWPAFEFTRDAEGDQVAGSLGCNSFGAAYAFDGEVLELREGSSTAMACALDGFDGLEGEESAMRAETEISAVLFAGPITVEFDGDGDAMMTMRSDGGEIVLERTGGRPAEGAAPDAPPVGPLECTDGPSEQELLAGSGLSQAEAARAADPAVVRTDNNLHTTFGFDAENRMIVEVQNSDTGIGDYLVYTCPAG